MPRALAVVSTLALAGLLPLPAQGAQFAGTQGVAPRDQAAQAAGDPALLTDADVALRAQAAATLRDALVLDEGVAAAAPPATRFGALRARAALAACNLPDGSEAQRRLVQALARADEHRQAAAVAEACRGLAGAVAELLADLNFQPLREAEVPPGFPHYRGVDELELRHYPAYRMARASMRRRGETGSFWVLFQHIKSHDIAMTSPVQIDYDEAADGRTRRESMAFLYGDAERGETGPDGGAEVVDVAPCTVISIGARGRERPSRIAELRERLDAWLDANAATYEAAGPMRLMSHNSPMVATARRFFEVQIPVRRKSAPTGDL